MEALLKALAKATGSMKRLSKDSRNIEQKYDFTSIDDFLAMVGPIYAENGLTTMIDETDVVEFERQGKYGVNYWLRVKFSFTTYHESGQHLPITHRTVEVIRTGAQSFGSAQSYALKQYLRGLHMIPTGDKDDADFADKGEGKPVTIQDEKPKQEPLITADQFLALRDKAELANVEESKIAAMAGIDDLRQLPAALFEGAMKKLQLTIDKKPKQNADLDGDAIPEFPQ